MRSTKIICTIGPASREPNVLAQLVREGMDVARLNMAHGSLEEHAENVRRIRAAAQEADRPVAIQVDLQGPKLRVGDVGQSGVDLHAREQVTLTTTRDPGGDLPKIVPIQNETLPSLVAPGDPVLIDDGLIELQVTEVRGIDVLARVQVGGRVQSNKGINLPGVSSELPALTDKDRQDLEAALDWGIDWFALSFVRTARGVRQLLDLIRERQETVPVMAKIEKPQALENLAAIIQAADAVMVARGDLGIEIPPEKVPMAQKRVIRACNEAGVPVVTATQMLDSMTRNPRPTRAEASDVANAILDGTDALMLSGETSIGAYPVQAVRTMVHIAREVEKESKQGERQGYRPVKGNRVRSIAHAVGHSARDVAHNLDAAAIITPTASGYTARVMSRYRPRVPVIAITPDQKVQRRLMLSWGVTPLLAPRAENTDEMIDHAVRTARERNLIRNGDTVVITGGSAHSEPGTTNLMRVYVVTQD
jgi:pyruvate kinase